ncbi:hypothetical protein LSCM1_04521 [Leishmania martiniquensis]|uniref:Nucleosome assembly protein n=1 Tax=Leishmania martiniquensis TaxID=1580590 RepID=A0A836KH33_9TRYP|nr:hypothetical protein LSCM1_04521 [Leishmania martiniquensis]
MELSQHVAEAIAKFTDDLVSVDRKCDEEANALRLEYRSKMEPLLDERRELLKGVSNFWSGVLSSPEAPISALLNGTIDPKIIRAVADFEVVTRVSEETLYRKIIFVFRHNMFVEEGEVSREIDADMKTTSLHPLKWKSGTERARTDSFFAFFTDDFSSDVEAVSDVVEALDIIHQNPFLAIEAE